MPELDARNPKPLNPKPLHPNPQTLHTLPDLYHNEGLYYEQKSNNHKTNKRPTKVLIVVRIPGPLNPKPGLNRTPELETLT